MTMGTVMESNIYETDLNPTPAWDIYTSGFPQKFKNAIP